MALALAQAASSHIASLRPEDFSDDDDTKEGILHVQHRDGPSTASEAVEVLGGDDLLTSSRIVEEEEGGIEIQFEEKGEAGGEGDIPYDTGEGMPMGEDRRNLPTLDCPVCGAKLKKSARLCNVCGTELATCKQNTTTQPSLSLRIRKKIKNLFRLD